MKIHEYAEVYSLVEGSGGNGTELQYSPQLGWVRGNTSAREVSKGFYVHWSNEDFDRELRLREFESPGYFIFTFSLSGLWRDVLGARRHMFERPGGTMAVMRADQLVEHRALPVQGTAHLTLAMQTSRLLGFLGERGLAEYPLLHRFVKGEGEACLVLPLTPRARQVVREMQNCPYHGLARSLSMEARCIDLLVEIIQQMQEPWMNRRLEKRRLLDKPERERIQEAAAHLSKSLSYPPTLAELARQFHLSESKLKAGFHQVFGTTAFGYLRKLRMEEARKLLESGRSTVLEAAHLVGISNPSHFSAMFKEHFGVNPKQFQMRSSRQRG